MKSMFDLSTRRRRKSTSTKPDGIQSDESCAIPGHHREGGCIQRKLRPTRSHHGFAHPRVLVKSRIGAEYGEVIDSSVAGQPTKTRDDRMVPDLTIMTDMRAVHDIVVIADSCTSAALRGPDMDRDLFPNLGTRANLEARRFAVKGPILRFGTEAGMRKDSAILRDEGAAQKRHMRPNFDAAAKLHFASDEGERADHHIRSQNRSVFDACRRMDRGQGISPFR